MIFNPLDIDGAWRIELDKHSDERGFFARAFCAEEFEQHGLESRFVQTNLSGNVRKHTLRGLHLQTEPYGEVKVVRCTRGAVFDVFVDLRPDSPGYRRWCGMELTPDNGLMLYIPRGCAHGYQTLRDDTDVLYFVSAPYQPGSERGVRWDDPALAIDWPEKKNVILSEKDRAWPLLDKESTP